MTKNLLLLHGLLGCGEDWDPLTTPLTRGRGCSTLTPDLPGHGRTPAPMPADFMATVAWVAEHIRQADTYRVDVVGYSMGGRLAMALALEYPRVVRRVVAVGASPGVEEEADRHARAGLDAQQARLLERASFEAWLDRWYGQPIFDGLRTLVTYPAMLGRRRQGDQAALAKALLTLSPGLQPPLRTRLAECAVPLLLMAGSEDRKYAESNAELAKLSPEIEVVTIPHAGHAPHMENADDFVHAVRSFLDRD